MTHAQSRRDPGRGGGRSWAFLELFGVRPRKQKQRTTLARLKYDDNTSLGNSPTIRDVEWLARKTGVRAILNLNTEGESGEILSPNVEASWAHTFEMQHERVSIDAGAPRLEHVDAFDDALRDIAKPVYVHSLSGRRAAAFMTVHLARERRISGSEALIQARALGIDCASELLRSFVVSAVGEGRAGASRDHANASARDATRGSKDAPSVGFDVLVEGSA